MEETKMVFDVQLVEKTTHDLQEIKVTKELLENPDFRSKYVVLVNSIELLKDLQDNLKAGIKDILRSQYEETGEVSLVFEDMKFTYSPNTSKVDIDKAKLKKEFPDAYNACLKLGQTGERLTVTQAKNKEA